MESNKRDGRLPNMQNRDSDHSKEDDDGAGSASGMGSLHDAVAIAALFGRLSNNGRRLPHPPGLPAVLRGHLGFDLNNLGLQAGNHPHSYESMLLHQNLAATRVALAQNQMSTMPIRPSLGQIVASVEGYQQEYLPLELNQESSSGRGAIDEQSTHHRAAKRRRGLSSLVGFTPPIVSLTRAERRAGFPAPSTRGEGRTIAVGSLTSFRKKWIRLSRGASSAGGTRSRQDALIRELFARSLHESDLDHLYKKVHGLSNDRA